MSHQPTKFLSLPKHALDVKSQRHVVKKLNALLNAKIVDEKGNVIGTVLYADGNTVFQFKSSGAGELYLAGEYDPTQSYPDASRGSQAIVFFTPDGGSAGAYYNLQPVAAGISPDTGFPNWSAWPNSPPGMFA